MRGGSGVQEHSSLTPHLQEPKGAGRLGDWRSRPPGLRKSQALFSFSLFFGFHKGSGKAINSVPLFVNLAAPAKSLALLSELFAISLGYLISQAKNRFQVRAEVTWSQGEP